MKTISIKDETWQELSKLKIDKDLETLDNVIRYLLSGRSGKDEKGEGR